MNKKEFIIILTSTFIAIMAWIASDIYHTKSAVPLDPKLQKILDPVDPGLDLETLRLIQNPPVASPLVIPETKTSTKSAELQ